MPSYSILLTIMFSGIGAYLIGGAVYLVWLGFRTWRQAGQPIGPIVAASTGAQVARGLYGAIVVRAPDDPLPPMTERVLLLSDNRFRADGSIDLTTPPSHEARIDRENGREGDVLFVNGELAHPVQEVTVAGNLLQMLKDLDAAGSDLTFRGSVGAPTVRFAQLTVSGT